MIEDRRTPEQRDQTVAYVVATDRFMSGWGKAPARSLLAIGCASWEQVFDVERRMLRHSEMSRVRVNVHLPRIGRGDHLSVVWYESFTYQPS
jgi:hypothetical protein